MPKPGGNFRGIVVCYQRARQEQHPGSYSWRQAFVRVKAAVFVVVCVLCLVYRARTPKLLPALSIGSELCFARAVSGSFSPLIHSHQITTDMGNTEQFGGMSGRLCARNKSNRYGRHLCRKARSCKVRPFLPPLLLWVVPSTSTFFFFGIATRKGGVFGNRVSFPRNREGG